MRSKGTHEEKQALAQFVNAMARNHRAWPREAVAAVLKEMLRSRDCAYGGGGACRRLRLPPLSSSPLCCKRPTPSAHTSPPLCRGAEAAHRDEQRPPP